MMDLADTPRQGDLDGRGNLSLKALHEFVEWLLNVALDQVQFMTELFDFDGLRARLESGLVTSQTQNGKLGLYFSTKAADVLFPRLFLTDTG